MSDQTPIKPGSQLAAEFWEKGRSESCPIYNMHGHPGEYHSMYMPRGKPADMLPAMDAAGVKMVCFAHFAALNCPDIGNRLAVEAVRAFPDRFRAYLAVNPHYPEMLARDLSEYDSLTDVYVGLKLLADYHKVRLSDVRYRRALEFADARGLLVLAHTYDGSPFNGPDEVRRVLDTYQHLHLLMGHSLNAAWEEAAAIARDHPNAHLELTGAFGQRGAVEVLCQGAGSGKMLFGTDVPMYGQHQAIGQLLSADITDEDIHNICHRTAEKLLGL